MITYPDIVCLFHVFGFFCGCFSNVKQMKLDESGSFTAPWPDDFFESSSDLTYERLKLTSKN